MKDTYGFDNKRIVRENLRELIRRNYTRAELKHIKVLTFLGHENYEIEQIWAPLGVQRENITVVEQDPEVHGILIGKKKELRVNLVEKPTAVKDYLELIVESEHGFVNGKRTTFDIINLDYTGYFNIDKVDTINLITDNQLLRKKSIFAFWCSGKRENHKGKMMIKEPSINDVNSMLVETYHDLYKKGDVDPAKLFSVGKIFDTLFEEMGRSENITRGIVNRLSLATARKKEHPLIAALGIRNELTEYVLQNRLFKGHYFIKKYSEDNDVTIEELSKAEQIVLMKKLLPDIERDDFFKGLSQKEKNEIAEPYFLVIGKHIFNELLQRRIRDKMGKFNYKVPEEVVKDIASLFMYQNINSYFIQEMCRYKYKSNKGTPMYVDMFMLNENDFKDLRWWDDGKFRTNLYDYFRKLNTAKAIRSDTYRKKMFNVNKEFFSPRIQIGYGVAGAVKNKINYAMHAS